MREHELKTWPEPFRAVIDGRKCYEIRRDDRGFAVGDVLHLREYERGPQNFECSNCGEVMSEYSQFEEYQHDSCGGLVVERNGFGYTGRGIRVRVRYMTPGGSWGLPSGLCVMSIERIEAQESAA